MPVSKLITIENAISSILIEYNTNYINIEHIIFFIHTVPDPESHP